MSDETIQTEEYQIKGDDLVTKIKELLHEGNIRRLIIKNEEGKILIEIPLTLGVFGAIILPTWAAIGAIAAIVSNCTLIVEKVEE